MSYGILATGPLATAGQLGLAISSGLTFDITPSGTFQMAVVRSSGTRIFTYTFQSTQASLVAVIKTVSDDLLNLERDVGKPQGMIMVRPVLTYYDGGDLATLSFSLVCAFQDTLDFELRSLLTRPPLQSRIVTPEWGTYRPVARVMAQTIDLTTMEITLDAYYSQDRALVADLGSSTNVGVLNTGCGYTRQSLVDAAYTAGVVPAGAVTFKFLGDDRNVFNSGAMGSTTTWQPILNHLLGISSASPSAVVPVVPPSYVPPLALPPAVVPSTDVELRAQVAEIRTFLNSFKADVTKALWDVAKTSDLAVLSRGQQAVNKNVIVMNGNVVAIGDEVLSRTPSQLVRVAELAGVTTLAEMLFR